MGSTNKIKICVGASAGGHMNQLLKLLEYSHKWPAEPCLYVTTMQELSKKLEKRGKTYVLGECNRHHPLEAMKVFWRGFKIMAMERPDVVITTGSMPIAMMCLSAKLFRIKVVWVDSIANVDRISLSGRLIYYFADLFITQWPELTAKYPKAQFAGAIL
jgi:UDP-N-acetylglucosamine:LPS N-acetylglucosamine transferase